MEIRQPAAAPAMTPLGAEDDEVVGPDRLHFAPGLAATACRVDGGSVLDNDALVPGPECLLEDTLGRLGIRRDHARDLQVRRERLEPCGALVKRGVEQVVSVDVEDVEDE